MRGGASWSVRWPDEATSKRASKKRAVLGTRVFFSSRRRHTRLQGDWSSDVCSSDLVVALELAQDLHQLLVDLGQPVAQLADVTGRAHAGDDVLALRVGQEVTGRFGRSEERSCRERV